MHKLILFLTLAAFTLSFSNDNWIQYTNSMEVTGIAEGNEWLWVTTSNGLAKVHKETNKVVHINRINENFPLVDINSIYIDRNNNKWICTSDYGLAKFDGKEWMIYDTLNSRLPVNHINQVVEDSKGNLWIATNGGGLVRLRGVNWEIFNADNSPLIGNSISSLALGVDDRLYIGNYISSWSKPQKAAFVILENNSWKVIKEYAPGNNIRMIDNMAFETNSETVWILNGNGILVYENQKFTIYDRTELFNNYFYAENLYIDNDNLKWFLGDRGILTFDNTEKQRYDKSNSGLHTNYITTMLVDENNIKWFGTIDGLAKFDDYSWEHIDCSNFPSTYDWVHDIKQDRQGKIWVGLSPEYLAFKIKPQDSLQAEQYNSQVPRFDHQIFDKDHWIKNKYINGELAKLGSSISIDSQNNVYFAGRSNMFIFKNADPFSAPDTIFDRSLNYAHFINSIEFYNDLVYYSYYWQNSLYKIENDSEVKVKVPENYKTTTKINDIILDENDKFWLAQDGSLLKGSIEYFSNKDYDLWESFDKSNSIIDDHNIRSLTTIMNSGILAATDKGLIIVSKNGNSSVYNTENSEIPGNNIHFIDVDINDRIYFDVNKNEVIMMKDIAEDKEIKRYNSQNSNLITNDITDITVDNEGFVWVTTGDNGIFVFTGINWYKYSQDSTGLLTNNFNCAFAAEDDNMYFGTNGEGIYIYDKINWKNIKIASSEESADTVYSIYAINENIIFAGTEKGLFYLKNDEWNLIHETNDKIENIMKNEKGWLTFSVNDVLYRSVSSGYSLPTSEIKVSDLSSDVFIDRINDLTEIKNNVLWAANSNGITKIWKNEQGYKFLPMFTDITCNAVSVSPYGYIWIGTSEGLAIYKNHEWIFLNEFNSWIPDNNVTKIEFDDYGYVWIGTERGAARLDYNSDDYSNPASWKIFTRDNSGLPNNEITAICPAENGDVWFGTRKGIGVLLSGEVSVKELIFSRETNLSVYPNPAKTSATLSFEMQQQGFADIFVTDIMGNNLITLSEKEFFTAGTHELSFKTAGLASGAYYLVVRNGAKNNVVQLIIRR